MYCGSCGAKLTEKDAKCPFCGTINPLGAEAHYMEKLEHIRKDTESLGDTPPEEYGRQLKHHGKFAFKISLIVITVFFVLFLIFQAMDHFSDYRDKKEQRAEIAFRKEYFPVLDELYAQGNDDEVCAYLDELYDKKGSSALYYWKHYAFYIYYDLYQSIHLLDEGLAQNDFSDYELHNGFYCALTLTQEGIWKSDYRSLSSEELSKITQYQEEATEMLIQDLGFTEDGIKEAYEECCDDGFLDYRLCEKYAESLKDQLS